MVTWLKPNGLKIETNDSDATLKKAVELGWTLYTDDIQNDGDAGSGKPGSRQWHQTAVKGMSSKEEIVDYIKEAFNEVVSSSGRLSAVKKRALEVINAANSGSNN